MRYLIGTVAICLGMFLAAYLAVSNCPDESKSASDGEVLWSDDVPPASYREY